MHKSDSCCILNMDHHTRIIGRYSIKYYLSGCVTRMAIWMIGYSRLTGKLFNVTEFDRHRHIFICMDSRFLFIHEYCIAFTVNDWNVFAYSSKIIISVYMQNGNGNAWNIYRMFVQLSLRGYRATVSHVCLLIYSDRDGIQWAWAINGEWHSPASIVRFTIYATTISARGRLSGVCWRCTSHILAW